MLGPSPSSMTAALINNGLVQSYPTDCAVRRGRGVMVSALDVATLTFFEVDTCWTLVCPGIWDGYSTALVRMALTRSYLLHTIVAISKLHQDWMHASSRPQASSLFHSQHALAAYNQRLRGTITAEDAVAIFSTSTLMNAVAFAQCSRVDAASSWPMTAGENALQWLSIQAGPARLLSKLGPLLFDSILQQGLQRFDDSSSVLNFHQELPQLGDLRSLIESTHGLGSPCCEAIDSLTPLFKLPRIADEAPKFLNFMGNLSPGFVRLLTARDPLALLVLAYWYTLIIELNQWWLLGRARTECTSICMFLERHRDGRIRALLEFPAHACGYSLLSDISMASVSLLPSDDLECVLM
ncbi:transcription factor [Recurvomyces mirabilis]|nr:transcription factor [Recurvomyces mirabilis]